MVSTTDACQDQLTWIWHSLSAGHDQETLATGWRWQWWRVGCRWNPAAAAAGLLSLIVDQIFTWIKSFTVVCETVSACYCVIITISCLVIYMGLSLTFLPWLTQVSQNLGPGGARSSWPERVLIVGWAAKEWWDNPIEAVMDRREPAQFHNLAQSLRVNVPVKQLLCWSCSCLQIVDVHDAFT